MTDDPIALARFLLLLAALLGVTALVAALLGRARVPSVIAALSVGAMARYTPCARALSEPPFADVFGTLAQLGVLFLLFFVGLQIDPRDVRSSGREVVLLTLASTLTPFLLGAGALAALGYHGFQAVVVGMTLMPTAEIVVVPILDEFGLLQTRAGQLIVEAGTLDDVVEVGLVAFVSAWLGARTVGASASDIVVRAGAGAVVLATLAWVGSRWMLPRFARWMPSEAHHLVMSSSCVLLGLVGVSTEAGLGPLVGAVTAGLVMRPTYARIGIAADEATQAFRQIGYGLLGALFFVRVGFALDVVGLVRAPALCLLLFVAGAGGKIGGVMLLRAAKRLSALEAWTVGVGLDARLTTEAIVAQLLFHAHLVSRELFGALVAASALSTLLVPIVFSRIVRRWGDRLRMPLDGVPTGG